MIILAYLSFVFLSGFSGALLFSNKQVKVSIAGASAFSVLIPSVLIYLTHILKINIRENIFLTTYFSLGILFILLNINQLKAMLFKLVNFLKSSSNGHRFYYLVVTLSFASFFLILYSRKTISGDGIHHWAPKAMDWIANGNLFFSDELKSKLLIFLNYPLLHSIEIMIHTMSLPSLSVYSYNISDGIHLAGIFCIFSILASFYNAKPILSITLGIAAAFAHRDLVVMVRSAYAEIPVAHYLTLSIFFFWIYIKDKMSLNILILSGIAAGMLAITKSEGKFRIIITFGILFFTLFPIKRFNPKELSAFFAPILILFLINYFSKDNSVPPNPYFMNLDLSFENLTNRFLLLFKVFLHMIKPKGLFDQFWIITMTLSTLITYESFRKSWRERYLFIGLLFAFSLNFVFSFIPMWIIGPENYSYSTDVGSISREVVGRINRQIGPMLSIIVVIGIIKLNIFHELKKYLNKFKRI